MHVKRSHQFQLQINSFISKLRSGTLDREECEDLISILQNHTTDTRCLVKAKDDEPIFVLRGQDALAANLVDAWATRASQGAPAKSADAAECANEMRRYPNQKFPD